MNYSILARVLSAIILITGAAMEVPLIAAILFEETHMAKCFGICSVIFVLVGLIGILKIRVFNTKMSIYEGFLIAACCWVTASVIGAVPYVATGYESSLIDAFYESVAGFTTTGSTVMDINRMPRSILLWKAMTHWLGGMGILVFAVSLMPLLGISGQQIFRAEAPGPNIDKMATRISDSAKILYITYIGFSILEFLLLCLSEMDTYDCLINTMGSISTGGLFSHKEGLAYFDDPYIEAVMSVFMVLASVNFTLYYYIFSGRFKAFFRDTELRVFLAILAAAGLMISVALYAYGQCDTIAEAFRYGFFQAISSSTTAGYCISNYNAWPMFCKMILIILMFIGGCAASTSCSVKVIRVIVVYKLIVANFISRLHPRAVTMVKVSGESMPEEQTKNIISFIMTYLIVLLLTVGVLSLDGQDLETTFTAALAAISNTGGYFGGAGEQSNYAAFSEFSKLFLSFVMILGRLEIMTVLILFLPSGKKWRKNR